MAVCWPEPWCKGNLGQVSSLRPQSLPRETPERASSLRLQRRRQHVVVRDPRSIETGLVPNASDRRRPTPTLLGLGARELLPTLYDSDPPVSRVSLRHPVAADTSRFPTENETTSHRAPSQPSQRKLGTPPPPTARARVNAICEMDEAETERILLEALRLSQSFEWDKE